MDKNFCFYFISGTVAQLRVCVRLMIKYVFINTEFLFRCYLAFIYSFSTPDSGLTWRYTLDKIATLEQDHVGRQTTTCTPTYGQFRVPNSAHVHDFEL